MCSNRRDFIASLAIGITKDAASYVPSQSHLWVEIADFISDLSEDELIELFVHHLPALSSEMLRRIEHQDCDSIHNLGIHDLFVRLSNSTLGALKKDHDEGPILLQFSRQLFEFAKKLITSPTPAEIAAAERKIVDVDKALPLDKCSFPSGYCNIARWALQAILPEVGSMDLRQRHGTGSVAEKEIKTHQKWGASLTFTAESEFLFGFKADWDRLGGRSTFVEHYISRVALVPKDSRGPRVICMEPAGLMYQQQALMSSLNHLLNNHPLLRGHCSVNDQSINRGLARESSITREFSTIDLSDASDRVSLALVLRLFPSSWLPFLTALRSKKCVLPSGRKLTFRKFAPMGSALCFPIEVLVFWAICISALARSTGLSWRKCAKMVYVYGDDIIVPTRHHHVTCDVLELFGLKVNREKSFSSSLFRESCGGDYYNGHENTPIRWKHDITGRRSEWLLQTVSLSNLFYRRGLYYTSLSISTWLRTHVPDPRILCGDLGDGRYSLLVEPFMGQTRFNRRYQRLEYRVFVPTAKSAIQLDDASRYRAWLHLAGSSESTTGVKVSPRGMRLSTGWVPKW